MCPPAGRVKGRCAVPSASPPRRAPAGRPEHEPTGRPEHEPAGRPEHGPAAGLPVRPAIGRGDSGRARHRCRAVAPAAQKAGKVDNGADMLTGHHLPSVLFQTNRERDPAAFDTTHPGLDFDRPAGEGGTGVVDRHASPDTGLARFEIRRHQLAASRFDPEDHGDRCDSLHPGVAHRGGSVAEGRMEAFRGGDAVRNGVHLVVRLPGPENDARGSRMETAASSLVSVPACRMVHDRPGRGGLRRPGTTTRRNRDGASRDAPHGRHRNAGTSGRPRAVFHRQSLMERSRARPGDAVTGRSNRMTPEVRGA